MSLKQFRANMTAITFYLEGIYKLLKRQRKVFCLCNSKVSYCKKTLCALDGRGECMHTSDINYAVNFKDRREVHYEESQGNKNTPELIFPDKCQNCPEFDSETRKEILHGDTIFAEVNIQITCKHRGLCDRIEEHLKNKLDNVSCTTNTS